MLDVTKTSTLGIVVVCLNCKHHRQEDNTDIWVDENGDVYYQGNDKETLAAFLFYHG